MTGRERARAAMRYQSVDKAPLQYYYTPVGYYEHGDKLNDLFAALPGDFEPPIRRPVPVIPPEEFDENGAYHSFTRDEWGTVWEKRIYGITGIPYEYPLADAAKIADYAFPPRAPYDARAARTWVETRQNEYYTLWGAGSLFERLRALRPDADVLCDLALDEPSIHDLADRIVAYHLEDVKRAVAAGADGISFGDDYGTERDLLISPALWRRFFKPRLKRLFAPAVDAGLDIVFHSCGKVQPILEDLCEVGATAIWPQLPAYNMEELAGICKALHLAVAIHTDRANTMTYGTPRDVRALVEKEFDTFRMMEGGSWFYVEADNGFPYENLVALVETIAQWRT